MSQCLLRACLDNHSTPFRQSLSWGGRLCAPSFLYVLQNLFFYARQSTEQPCFAAASLSFSSAAWALFKGYQWAISVLQPVLFGFIVWLWQPLLWSLLLGLQCTTVQEVCLRFRKPFCYDRQMWCVFKGVFLMFIAYFSCSDMVEKEVVTYCLIWRINVK